MAAAAENATFAGTHITDVHLVKGCNYACLRQKTRTEDSSTLTSSPCLVVWDDLARLARYKLADAALTAAYYDAGSGEQMAAMASFRCVEHDLIGLGADMASSEVSNIVPSLTRESLDEDPLAEVYSRLLEAMVWYRDNHPHSPAALAILLTH